jgi:hypothetical protein
LFLIWTWADQPGRRLRIDSTAGATMDSAAGATMNSVVGATMETQAGTAMEVTVGSVSIAGIDAGIGVRLEPTSTEQPSSPNIAVSW